MKFIRLNNYFAPGNICLFFLVCVLSLSNNYAQAQKKSKKKSVQYEAELSFATIYDNNILKYSEKYLDRFMNNEDPGRFHIDTYDDVILYQSADLSSTFRIFKDLRTKIDFEINNSLYVVNSIKNWYFVTLGLQQYVTKRASFKVFYSYIPEFYVRHFRDQDLVDIYGYTPITFVPFSFSKDNYGFWLQNTFFKSTRLRLAFDYSQYYYNKHYTEYDSKNFLYAINIYQTVYDKIRLEAGFHYLTSDAKGYDEPGETKAHSNDADASFVEDGWSFGVDYQFPRIKKFNNDLDLQMDFQKRYFTTTHYVELDPEHAGRVDNCLQMSVTYNFDLSKSWNLSAFYNFFFRDSYSSSDYNKAYLNAEKDFRQSQIGVKVIYYIKI